MAKDILKNQDPKLQAMIVEHSAPAPKEIPMDAPVLKRVARPLRHVKFIPIKSLIFHTKTGPMDFSYEKKIKTPIPKNKIVVRVSNVGLNPVDMKIRNGYTSSIYGEIGLGREYSGVITEVGENLNYAWHVGDEVYGIYYHPHLAVGCLQSSILVDPKVDPILLRPESVSAEEAAGSLFCLATGYIILNKLSKNKYLKQDSNVLINGGTSSVGMFVIQLLKRHYKLQKKLVIVTSANGPQVLQEKFPDLADEMIFIDYLTCRGKSSKPLRKMLEEKKISQYDPVEDKETILNYNEGKFDVVLDFVGGYDILSHSSSLIHGGGAYVTTVGDYVANYKEDIFDSWDNPSANARKMFGSIIWSYNYTHYYFDPNAKTASANNDWIEQCGDFLKNGTVKCVVDKVYDWKDHKEAFSYMATQRAQGKLIMNVEKF
ncbi:AIS_HP2_G0001260.mRNA.1.CDS.1 [Saccharomyces cerevisiae]|nr:AIS_HP2_G0001260.mRNA.1.CDS.1 [Saccharomyces cerevisiae]CAI6385218.1 AIS_HP1_G0001180.mRNA.1.CDS.1 [Saccharomyces cerevisiae]CAI6386888.1 AIS_HP2_G0001260.mRNA.1.CDS.1 [Saccharomyces cerevisiae]CAI6477020.1 AIS_collapsed_G0001230.mRNA.1.CDS.1 [Saccharomyces cerevisiae]